VGEFFVDRHQRRKIDTAPHFGVGAVGFWLVEFVKYSPFTS
jgi:hypothetical protein